MRDLDEIREGIRRFEAAKAERSRAAAPTRGRRPATRSRIAAGQKKRMRSLVARTYLVNPPPEGSPRDLRLRVLALSTRELAKRAGISANTVSRAERAFEAGDADTVGGPHLRKLAAALERSTGRRVKITDVRAPRRDA